MRLVTFQRGRATRIGAAVTTAGSGGLKIVDVLAAAGNPKRGPLKGVVGMLDLLEGGRPAMAAAKRAVRAATLALKAAKGRVPASLKGKVFDLQRVRLLAPVPRPPKFVCVGLNYRDHALEAKLPLPEYPVLFNKFPSTVVGPADPIVLPRISKKVDYEGEFAVVIGRRGRDIPKARALDFVAGYTIVNDISARDLQNRTSQWLPGKSCDGFGVMGPWLVTADEVGNPHNLTVRTWVDGELRQSSNTKHLIFDVNDLIADMSRLWTLEPGDIISTGTPSGVGAYFKPPRLLKAGQRVRIEIEKVGTLENRVEAEKRPASRRGR